MSESALRRWRLLVETPPRDETRIQRLLESIVSVSPPGTTVTVVNDDHFVQSVQVPERV